MDYYQPLYSNGYYHIYNRGNNGENLFYKRENYNYFLRKYDYYLGDYISTFAYCLLPNHFHLLVHVKDLENQKIELKKGTNTLSTPEDIVSELFRRLFLSYAKAINKQEPRTGSLFQKNFKRKKVNNEQYFNQLVYYIHANPQHHGICSDFREYSHSSYERILSDKPSKLFKQQVLKWFGDKDTYLKFHGTQQDTRLINSWMIEDD